MSLLPLALVILAAFIHATWNLLAKRAAFSGLSTACNRGCSATPMVNTLCCASLPSGRCTGKKVCRSLRSQQACANRAGSLAVGQGERGWRR